VVSPYDATRISTLEFLATV